MIGDAKRPHKVIELGDIAGAPNALAIEPDTNPILDKHVDSQTKIIGEIPIISVTSAKIDFG